MAALQSSECAALSAVFALINIYKAIWAQWTAMQLQMHSSESILGSFYYGLHPGVFCNC